jgi:putative membrane protein
MMLVFGVYALYIEAVSTLNPVMLAVFGISMVLGVLAGMGITKKLLLVYPQALYFAILGFIAGSLLIMYPGLPMDLEGLLSIVLGIGFAVLAYWLSTKDKGI